MIFFNCSNVTGKRYPMATGSGLLPSILKNLPFTIRYRKMLDFCRQVAKQAQTGTILFSEIKPGFTFQNFRTAIDS